MNKFSIVIVTYGRTKELSQLLGSISKQDSIDSLDKIVIVDNHPSKCGEEIAKSHSSDLNIHYIVNKLNSLTLGRSIGAQSTNSDVILFLDDDIILDDNYFKNLLKFYNDYPQANGMQGMFHVDDYSRLKNFFNRVFWLFNYSSNDYKVYPSIQASYAKSVDKITMCEWFSGTNFSYKRYVINQIPFDFKLVKYCEGEDIDYSYRVYKEFGDLYINPRCSINHQASITSREIGEEFAVMQEIYGLYLLKKLFPDSKVSNLKYFVSRLGKLIIFSIELARFKPHSLKNIVTYIKALHKAYFNGDIDSFNKEIL